MLTFFNCFKKIVLPYNDYLEYYSPDFNLSVPTSQKMINRNTREYLENLLCATLNNLKNIQGRPVPVDVFFSSSSSSSSLLL